MLRVAKVRTLLALLGVFFLLANPAGICAGTPSAKSPSHPCCPKPSADAAKAPCICIDRQPAAPTVPSLSEQSQFDAIAPVPVLAAEMPANAPEYRLEDTGPLAPHAIILSIHQLLL
jgi:hypothetical protein